jgi:hypothetical protein
MLLLVMFLALWKLDLRQAQSQSFDCISKARARGLNGT